MPDVDGITLLKEWAAGGRPPCPIVIMTGHGTLETAVEATGRIEAWSGWSEKFIYPPYSFRAVDALVTNFHLPESTLLMLISAFAGKEQVMHCYHEAIAHQYRFFSYGDAMFIE